MKVGRTARGFERIEFDDANGIKCSLQQSSVATEDLVWLGCNEANPRVLVQNEGWKPMTMPADYVADTRMHLNRKTAKEIIKHLQSWLKSGSLKP